MQLQVEGLQGEKRELRAFNLEMSGMQIPLPAMTVKLFGDDILSHGSGIEEKRRPHGQGQAKMPPTWRKNSSMRALVQRL